MALLAGPLRCALPAREAHHLARIRVSRVADAGTDGARPSATRQDRRSALTVPRRGFDTAMTGWPMAWRSRSWVLGRLSRPLLSGSRPAKKETYRRTSARIRHGRTVARPTARRAAHYQAEIARDHPHMPVRQDGCRPAQRLRTPVLNLRLPRRSD
jgi:hypothetical protein